MSAVREQLAERAWERWSGADTAEMVKSLRNVAGSTTNIDRQALLIATGDRLEQLAQSVQEMFYDRVEDDAAELGHVLTPTANPAGGYSCSCGDRDAAGGVCHLLAVVEAHLVAAGHRRVTA